VKGNLFMMLCFAAGACLGRFTLLARAVPLSRAVTAALLALIFLVGVGVGSNVGVWRVLREMHFRIVLVPLAVALGTSAGAAAVSVFLREISLVQSLAIGCGFGYYSLSSVIIEQIWGDMLGMTALLSNLIREAATLLLAPVLVRLFGRLAPVAAGGATSMDTSLPVISHVSGKEYAVVSVFSGMVLTLLVPFLIPILSRFGP
jgi:uncharacterized membrane protein YbjE (DUF340 family)